MKKHALAVGILFCGIALPAFAQESDAPTWTGYHLGVNAGFRWGQTQADYQPDFLGKAGAHHTFPIGGAQFGYDRQIVGPFQLWVIGFEADAEFDNSSAHYIPGPPVPHDIGDVICVFPTGAQCVRVIRRREFSRLLETPGDVSARLRGGLKWRNALIYFTVGMAVANTSVNARDRYFWAPLTLSASCVEVQTLSVTLPEGILRPAWDGPLVLAASYSPKTI